MVKTMCKDPGHPGCLFQPSCFILNLIVQAAYPLVMSRDSGRHGTALLQVIAALRKVAFDVEEGEPCRGHGWTLS